MSALLPRRSFLAVLLVGGLAVTLMERTLPMVARVPFADTIRPTIANLAVTAVTGTSATLHWTTDEPTSATVRYANDDTGVWQDPVHFDAYGTDHTHMLTALQPGTQYRYLVEVFDRSRNGTLDQEHPRYKSFQTPSSSQPLVLLNIRIADVTKSSATFMWDTNLPADAQVAYGLESRDPPLLGTEVPSGTTAHRIALSNLQRGRMYFYRIASTDARGNVARSPDRGDPRDFYFQTEDLPDREPTIVISTQPEQHPYLPGMPLGVSVTVSDDYPLYNVWVRVHTDEDGATVVENTRIPQCSGQTSCSFLHPFTAPSSIGAYQIMVNVEESNAYGIGKGFLRGKSVSFVVRCPSGARCTSPSETAATLPPPELPVASQLPVHASAGSGSVSHPQVDREGSSQSAIGADISSCATAIAALDQRPLFTDIERETPQDVRAIHLLVLLDGSPATLDERARARFSPRAPLTRKELVRMATLYSSLLEIESDAWLTALPKKMHAKPSRAGAVQALSRAFNIDHRTVSSFIKRESILRGFFLKGEMARLLYLAAEKVQGEDPETALCRLWQEQYTEEFSTRFWSEGEKTAPSAEAQFRATSSMGPPSGLAPLAPAPTQSSAPSVLSPVDGSGTVTPPPPPSNAGPSGAPPLAATTTLTVMRSESSLDRYTVVISDPSGLRTFRLTKADGGDIGGGNGDCPSAHGYSGSVGVTLTPADFPIAAKVTACSDWTFTVQANMPPLAASSSSSSSVSSVSSVAPPVTSSSPTAAAPNTTMTIERRSVGYDIYYATVHGADGVSTVSFVGADGVDIMHGVSGDCRNDVYLSVSVENTPDARFPLQAVGTDCLGEQFTISGSKP